MKKILYTIGLIIISHNGNAMKIKYRGWGGIVYSEGGSPQVCPNPGSELCAIVEGSFRDLVRKWWHDTFSSTSEVINVQSLTYYEDGVPHVINNTSILITNPVILNYSEYADEVDVTGTGGIDIKQ